MILKIDVKQFNLDYIRLIIGMKEKITEKIRKIKNA